MTGTLLKVHDDEWRVLGNAVAAAEAELTGVRPSLNRGPGTPWHRDHWTVLGLDGTVVVVGHASSVAEGDSYDVSLPVELVRNAVEHVNTGDSCDLMLDGCEYVGVRSENGSVAVTDAEEPVAVEVPFDCGTSVSGTAGAMDLWRAIGGAGQIPGTVHPDLRIPVMQIGIEDGSIGFSVDWRRYSLNRSTYRAPAAITDSSGAAGFTPATITRLLASTASRRADIAVEVGIGEDWVIFDTFRTGGGWKAWAPRLPVGALEYAEEVEEALEAAGLEWGWSGPGHIIIEAAAETGSVVEVGFFDTWPETLRLSTVLADGLKENIELHRALANLNARKVGLRFWFERGHVIAASDLPCYRHVELAVAVRHLCTQTEGLGILLQSSHTVGVSAPDGGGAQPVDEGGRA